MFLPMTPQQGNLTAELFCYWLKDVQKVAAIVKCIFVQSYDTLRQQKLIDKAVEIGFPLIDVILGLRMHRAPRYFQLLS